MSFMYVKPDLGNQRVCKGELSQGIDSNRELADAHDSYAKLGQGKDAAGKLADGNHTYSRNWDTVCTILEGNVK